MIVEKGGTETTELVGSFREYIRVRSLIPTDASIQILTAQTPQVTPQTVKLPFVGRGWLLKADRAVQIDGSHEAIALNGLAWPIPFHLGIEEQGEAVVYAGTEPARPIACIDLNNNNTLANAEFRVQNMSEVLSITSTFADGQNHESKVASHLNAASFRCFIPPSCNGLLLRKTYDRFHGRQRARVLVDGVPSGWWYEPVEDRNHRWGVGFFGIGEEFVRGKDQINITIDPPAGAPLWSFSRLEVFAF